MSEVDELPAMREELARLQAELAEVSAMEATARSEFEQMQETIVFDEYSKILSALAPPRQLVQKKAFPRLLGDDETEKIEDAPDAFAFMSLMQATAGDDLALRARAAKLPHVYLLTAQHIDELLQLAPQVSRFWRRSEINFSRFGFQNSPRD